MYYYPIFDLDDFPSDVADAFELIESFKSIIRNNQDYVEWPLELSIQNKRNMPEEVWENYQVVTNFILDELSDDDGELNFVLIRTY